MNYAYLEHLLKIPRYILLASVGHSWHPRTLGVYIPFSVSRQHKSYRAYCLRMHMLYIRTKILFLSALDWKSSDFTALITILFSSLCFLCVSNLFFWIIPYHYVRWYEWIYNLWTWETRKHGSREVTQGKSSQSTSLFYLASLNTSMLLYFS